MSDFTTVQDLQERIIEIKHEIEHIERKIADRQLMPLKERIANAVKCINNEISTIICQLASLKDKMAKLQRIAEGE